MDCSLAWRCGHGSRRAPGLWCTTCHMQHMRAAHTNVASTNQGMASRNELRAFEVATRDLAGLALRSIDHVGDDISLPQFRLLLVLYEQGPCSSNEAARAMGLVASSVTRLADRLTASGYLIRGTDPTNRCVVTLNLTDPGKALVKKVIRRRRRELAKLLSLLAPDVRAACAYGLQELHTKIGDKYTVGRHGLMPL